jgi:hypothetical protein
LTVTINKGRLAAFNQMTKSGYGVVGEFFAGKVTQ